MHPVHIFRDLKQTFWFLPAVLFACSILLYGVTLFLDAQFSARLQDWLPEFVTGSPDAARVLLSTIAASVITVVSISFSITLLAFQQTATQYSSRVLRSLTQKSSFQIVLGTYIGTFLYALLVLQSIEGVAGVDGSDFVPIISILVALTLTVICMALLVYFISSVVRSLQAAEIVRHVHVEMMTQLERIYPDSARAEAMLDQVSVVMKRSTRAECTNIYAEEPGFLVQMNDSELKYLTGAAVDWIRIVPQVGSFIIYGQVLAEVRGILTEEEEKHLRASFVLSYQRSVEQDPLFPYRQLVDIALKALSPALNETTTAEYCLMRLSDGLARLLSRQFPGNVRYIEHEEKTLCFMFNNPTWEDFVTLSFSQMIAEASGNAYMLHRIGDALHELEQQATTPKQRDPIWQMQQWLRACKYG